MPPESPALPDKPLLRPSEVAKFFDVSTRTIYLWIEIGILDGSRIGGTIRVTREAVLAAVKSSSA